MIASRKNIAFWAITLALPFLALGLAELGLRVTGLFAPEPLVLEIPESQGTFAKFNPWVPRRYFDSSFAAIPNLAPQRYLVQKPPSTFRILCLGASTTAGFPFQAQVPFPAQLREMLSRAYPRRRIEVLNAGISAISSYVVLDLLPELLRATNPDLVVAYLGHNEFYGVYGSASTLFPGKKRELVLLTLRLQHLHVVQMMKRLIGIFKPSPTHLPGDRTLMQSVIGDQSIPLGSAEYASTMVAFQENLLAIADLCRERKIPILFGNLVSNVRDQAPFHDPAVSSSGGGGSFGARLRAGDSLLSSGDVPGAAKAFQEAWRQDRSSADAWFGMGRVHLAQGDSNKARLYFLGAKDRDGMRFRASEEANVILSSTAAASGAGFVDLQQAFESASPGRMIGAKLMCDHLHPNPRGYALMAATFCQRIISMGVLPPPDSSVTLSDLPFGVTDLDWDIGLIKIFPMIHEWPFKSVKITPSLYHPHGDTAATRVAAQFLRYGFAWTRAHDMMAQIYLGRGDLERARLEYRAVAVYEPDDPWPFQQIAHLYELEANWPMRSWALEEALIRSPFKGLIAYQLALSEWKQHRISRAIRAMEFAAGAPELKPAERKNARFYLAGFFSDDGRRGEAIHTLRKLLAEDPGFAPAKEFLSRLERRLP
jgi:lysophospholipase L1-like esterase